MKRVMSIVFAAMLSHAALAVTDAKLLNAIGMVESGMNHRAVGDGGRALGAYQMHPEAWHDANNFLAAKGMATWPRSAWRDARVQRIMADAYLSVIRKRLRGMGYLNPTPAQLALCWNFGPGGARREGFRITPYAQRVVSIARN